MCERCEDETADATEVTSKNRIAMQAECTAAALYAAEHQAHGWKRAAYGLIKDLRSKWQGSLEHMTYVWAAAAHILPEPPGPGPDLEMGYSDVYRHLEALAGEPPPEEVVGQMVAAADQATPRLPSLLAAAGRGPRQFISELNDIDDSLTRSATQQILFVIAAHRIEHCRESDEAAVDELMKRVEPQEGEEDVLYSPQEWQSAIEAADTYDWDPVDAGERHGPLAAWLAETYSEDVIGRDTQKVWAIHEVLKKITADSWPPEVFMTVAQSAQADDGQPGTPDSESYVVVNISGSVYVFDSGKW